MKGNYSLFKDISIYTESLMIKVSSGEGGAEYTIAVIYVSS